jgi:methylamine dehydrogenase heavy chain
VNSQAARRIRANAILAAWFAFGILAPVQAASQTPAPELASETSDVATLPPPTPHRVWVQSIYSGSIQILDGDTGAMLSTVHSASLANFANAPGQAAIYVAETIWSKGNRGVRQDMVTVYDGASLKLLTEIPLPGRAYMAPTPRTFVVSGAGGVGYVYNLEPASSVIAVDLPRRKVLRSIDTPGCAYIYPWGERGFSSLCGNGSLATVDWSGKTPILSRSAPFFDAENDPVFEESPSDARTGKTWFVSFTGRVFPATLGAKPTIEPGWSLQEAAGLAHATSEAGVLAWRPGGRLPMAAHFASGRLYVLMHAGEAWTHKQTGTELWVVDTTARKVLRRLTLSVAVNGVAVSQDNAPLLYLVDAKNTLSIRKADTLEEVRTVENVGLSTPHVPDM